MFSHLLIKYLPCFVFKKRTQRVPLIRPMQKVQRNGVTTLTLVQRVAIGFPPIKFPTRRYVDPIK